MSSSESEEETKIETIFDSESFQWMQDIVNLVFSTSEKHWKAVKKEDETSGIITNFFKTEDSPFLLVFYFSPTNSNELRVNSEFPSNSKGRLFYFIKREETELTKDIMFDFLKYGAIHETPLRALHQVLHETFMPLLVNRKSSEVWPLSVYEEIFRLFHKASTCLDITIGLSEGCTNLPLPLKSDIHCDREALGKIPYHEIEDTVQLWISQIRHLINIGEGDYQKTEHTRFNCVHLIDYWEAKSKDLNHIQAQICSSSVRNIITCLKNVKSAYLPSLNRVLQQLKCACIEAKDNYVHLKSLKPHFLTLTQPNETSFFEDMLSCLRPIFHIILLIAKHSKYFSNTISLSGLLELIFDEVILQIRLNVSNIKVFHLDHRESEFLIQNFLHLCDELFFVFRELCSSLKELDKEKFNFDNIDALSHLNQFNSRLKIIQTIVKMTYEFEKLGSLEIGGPKGKILSAKLKEIHQGIMEGCNIFKTSSVDPFDYTDKRLEEDYERFLRIIDSCESSMGSTISEGLQCCCSPSHFISMLDTFQEFSDHEHVKKYIDEQLESFLDSVDNELDAVNLCFKRQNMLPPTSSNLPPTSASILWAKNLLKRLEPSIARVEAFQNNSYQKKESQILIAKYEVIKEQICEYISSLSKAWIKEESSGSDEGLKKPIFVKLEEEMLQANFDPALMAVIKEIQYYESFELEVNISEKAKELRAKSSLLELDLRKAVHIADKYNTYQSQIKSIERSLLSDRLAEVDRLIERGMNECKWESDNLDAYLSDTLLKVKDITDKVHFMQSNMENVSKLILSLNSSMVDRFQDGRGFLNIEGMPEYFTSKNAKFAEVSGGIQEAIETTRKEIGATEDSAAWETYLQYYSKTVKILLFQVIETTLEHALQMTDPYYVEKNSIFPLVSVKVSLSNGALCYTPDVDKDITPSLHSIIASLCDNTLLTLTHLEKIDKKSQDFFSSISENKAVQKLIVKLMDRADFMASEVRYHSKVFEEFSYLWTQSKEEYMDHFLEFGYQVGTQDDELFPRPVGLEDFNQQIEAFMQTMSSMKALEVKETVNGWVSLDKAPVISSITAIAKGWKQVFTSRLLGQVKSSINEHHETFQRLDEGLSKKVERPCVVEMMSYIREMKAKETCIDEEFVILKDGLELLSSFEVEFSPEVEERIDSLEKKWYKLQEKATSVRDVLTPLCDEEAAIIKENRKVFYRALDRYKGAYKTNAPYMRTVTTEFAYAYLDQFWLRLKRLRKQASNLKQSEELFDLSVSQTDSELQNCTSDLKVLQTVWSMVSLVQGMFSQWYATNWKSIDMEELELTTKRIVREIKSVVGENEKVKQWDIYKHLDSLVKNMKVSIKASSQLNHPAVKRRHWKYLMEVTGIELPEDENMTFREFLDLKLIDHVDDVLDIVDRAVKEYSMDKSLKEISDSWTSTKFPIMPLQEFNSFELKLNDNFQEKLEEDQVVLQNLLSSKFVAHFYSDILLWQKKLALIESVAISWAEIQQLWLNMAKIFMCSRDLREKLPDTAEIFDQLNNDWKVLVKSLNECESALKTSEHPNLLTSFEEIQKKLQLSERALAQYLDGKREEFPRFYFVSSYDLMDILAHGHDPRSVVVHFTKIFDNVEKLDFKDCDTAEAVAIVSTEGENVPLFHPLKCEGVVTEWLSKLSGNIKETLAERLADAVSTYEDKPRSAWLFDFCAQVTLVAAQVWFTTEVQIAFDRILQGHETSLMEFQRKQFKQLNQLVELIKGQLSPSDRQKVVSLCINDVHSRDVITSIINNEESELSVNCFLWQSQLRYRWDENINNCGIDICDANFEYNFEYIGNCSRLVVTPLTDRCYITLTQSVRLMLGGAPTGPAGTGKTETVKELGRALGTAVFVFNCSDQMDYRSLGNIYRGLAETGTWGCFDEFNRISAEVLSVVSSQVKSILNALKAQLSRFVFQGDEINLISSCSIFITMNPGYQGRVELPENMKALFRPCSMVLPDTELICEIMLLSAGFNDSKIMARKFTTLYSLCADLLSKQDQYDWGLRAMKTVLLVTSARRQQNLDLSQEQLLLLCLRDANVPRLVAADKSVFHGLITDLFPGVSLEKNNTSTLESTVKKAMKSLSLQPDEVFVSKVIQLDDIMTVRHSIFIIGASGTGKSSIRKVLENSYHESEERVFVHDLDPKAIEKEELYGYINTTTGEWKDGIFSHIMRNLSQMENDSKKWIIIDGDIDTNWIESLNTVMDDNKVLTLASNERIALTSSMRLIFETDSLKYSNPSTVSRAGIIFMGINDFSWVSYVQSWADARGIPSERGTIQYLFEKYVYVLKDYVESENYVSSLYVTWFSMVQTLCSILECVLPANDGKDEVDRELYELHFMFSCVWAFGGCLAEDVTINHKTNFNNWWRIEFKTIKFPVTGSIFDFKVDHEQKRFVSWSEYVPPPSGSVEDDFEFGSRFVPTSETVKYKFVISNLVSSGKPVLLYGNSGCGKTVLLNDILEKMMDVLGKVDINFNHYTTSATLQSAVEGTLEKKSGRNLAPPGTSKLIYFIDDFNLPQVDEYGTQSPHSLLRQYLSYNHWYDRTKLTVSTISNVQFIACMNPTAGSFFISERLQRRFATFALSFPSKDSLKSIFGQMLNVYLSTMPNSIKSSESSILNSALGLHLLTSKTFLPTVVKFHYQFNLRDLSKIFHGMLRCDKRSLNSSQELLRLWVHESRRVYSDRLVSADDIEKFEVLLKKTIRSYSESADPHILHEKPLIFTHFAKGLQVNCYSRIQSSSELKMLLDTALESYNENNAMMDLVLFDDAMSHVCRIANIISERNGHAMLVGVGGSGKQSLARLASYICNYEVYQISIQRGYKFSDLKNDLATVLNIAGVADRPVVFLITDSQIVEEEFLIPINDLLSGNDINVFTNEQMETLYIEMAKQLKEVGLMNNRENAWGMFCSNLHQNLHIIFCCSPVSTEFRTRCRKFPGLTHCTSIDWFHEWPAEALQSVASKFLSTANILENESVESIVMHMSYMHDTVNEVSSLFKEKEGRYNYTTPKSFFELLKLYRVMAVRKKEELKENVSRLETGLSKLNSASLQVDEMKKTLAFEEKDVEEKSAQVNAMLERVMADQEKANKERSLADQEEQKVRAIKQDVAHKQEETVKELLAAQPALDAARAALDTLDKNNLIELKSFQNPGKEVKSVMSFVLILLSSSNKQLRRDLSWKAAKFALSNIGKFLEQLHQFDKDNIPDTVLEAVEQYVNDSTFNGEQIRPKSVAAAGICEWGMNVLKYNSTYRSMKPMRDALSRANAQLSHTVKKLESVREKLQVLDDRISKLTASFQTALSEKNLLAEKAMHTQNTIALANRLVQGLALENVRWTEASESYKKQKVSFVGDVLIASGYVSYTGSFSKPYRDMLLYKKWIPRMADLSVKPDFDPLSILVEDAEVAKWNNEGLPKDRISIENAALIKHSQRWPLIVDPQLQALVWLKHKEGEENLKTVTIDQKDYLDHVEKSISNGDHVLIENISEYIDPMLETVLGGQTIKKGKYIKIGGREIDYDQNFRLYLHTKLANPHFPPELQAQVTIINFTVTKQGLEDQLLGSVVTQERPDLEMKIKALTLQQNEYKIRLKDLEDVLLAQISSAEGNFLGDTVLVESLEKTKNTSEEIQNQVEDALVTESNINEIREKYRPVAQRASIMFFLVNDLNRINSMYQFSLSEFNDVFIMSLMKVEECDEITERIHSLVSSITFNLWQYVSRALFEKDQLIFTSQLTFNICMNDPDPNFTNEEVMFLVQNKIPHKKSPHTDVSPLPWLSNESWSSISYLSTLDSFKDLDQDILGSAKRWKKWSESETPELELMPQEWKSKLIYQRLSIIKAFRMDRMKHALLLFIEEKLGRTFIDATPVPLENIFKETNAQKPVFFILSAGLDPIKNVSVYGESKGYTEENGKFINVSLGQGQEIIAENMLEKATKEGLWLMLQNIHLAPKWLTKLEDHLEHLVDQTYAGSESFRLFLTSEAFQSKQIIPVGILQNSMKITDEPPSGLKANMLVAIDHIPDSSLEACTKETEFKKILFSLCFFHAIVVERRKFGSGGWCKPYPFSMGDLLICKNVLLNYLENSIEVPWTDIRYIFGEIMYGGHISDPWDRRLCSTYLEVFINRDAMEGYAPLAPGVYVTPSLDMAGYRLYVEESFPHETSYLFGLHPNTEIEVLTTFTTDLCNTLFQLRGESADETSNYTKEDRVKSILDDLTNYMPNLFNMEDIANGIVEKNPYIVVACNEVERMNVLLEVMKKSVNELLQGLQGSLTMNESMEGMLSEIYTDNVPKLWSRFAYPSLKPLGVWYKDLQDRCRELETWVVDFKLPIVVWLSGLFNPQSFLTAIMQTASRKMRWSLDSTRLKCDVTKKEKHEIMFPARDGVFLTGLYMEGARWDTNLGYIQEAHVKQLNQPMPVIFLKAVQLDGEASGVGSGFYECPLYKTKNRGSTYIWKFALKTREPSSKWILAGVCLLLSN